MLLKVALRVSPVAHHPRDQAVSLVDRAPWVVDEATLHRSPLPGILVAGIRAQLADLQLEAALGLVAVTRRLHRALVLRAEPGAEPAAPPVPQPGPQREPESDEHQDHKDRDDDDHRGHMFDLPRCSEICHHYYTTIYQ